MEAPINLEKELRPLQSKARDLVEKGRSIYKTDITCFHEEDFVYSYLITGERYRTWVGEVFTYANRHLKGHPLFQQIENIATGYLDGSECMRLISCMEVIANDEEFFLTLNSADLTADKGQRPAVAGDKIFIVHGHDEAAKQEVARILKNANFQPIILHEQANSGKTIIEKIEVNTDVAFAVVLYTPCDLGRAKEQRVNEEQTRARQNVVFEHGYLIGKLGRSHVCALVKGDVETPGDIDGIVYIPIDSGGAWRFDLAKEMKAAGLDVDANKFL